MLLLAVPALRMIFLGGEHHLGPHHSEAKESQ